MKRTPLILAIAAVGLLFAGLLGLLVHQSGVVARLGDGATGSAAIGGPFSLTDHTGRQVTDEDFRGALMLVFFGYTFCPDVCPTTLQNMAVALDMLGEDAAEVRPVFITVDPERDTADVLADYVAAFGPRFVGLRGSEAEIAEVAKRYRVYYRKVDPEKDPDYYLVDHLSFIYLMGRDGAFVDTLAHGMAPEEMAAKLRERL